MEEINFNLTEKQTELLEPIFERAQGELGVVFAQVFDAEEGPGFVEVRFVKKDVAMNVQRAMGVKPGKLHTRLTFIETEL